VVFDNHNCNDDQHPGSAAQEIFMSRSTYLRLTKLALAVSVTAAAIGCDDPHQADRRVRETIEQSRLAQASGPEGQEKAQTLLQQAAAEANAAAATKAHAKGMLAQAEFDSAISRMSNPQNGVDAGNRAIAGLLFEIGQLGQQIGSSNSLVTTYRAYEPKSEREAVQQRIAEATGAPDKAAWIGEGGVAVPTLAAVKQEIARLQDQVAKQQQQLAALQDQQKQTAQDAEKAAREADAVPGKEGLEQFRKAADLRKRAADLANQIEVAQAQLAPVQQDLALAQARQLAVTNAIEQFKRLGQQVEQGWQAVQQQIARQRELATAVLQGNAQDPQSGSIAQMSATMAEQAAQTQKSYDEAVKNLTDSITHYEDAEKAAGELARDLTPRKAELPSDNQMRKALDTLVAVYNPVVFKLGQANANLALANLRAGRAQMLNERLQLINSLTPALKEAELALPKELADSALPAEIKEVSGQAAAGYDAATSLYTDVSSAPSVDDSTKNAGHGGRIYSLYGRALLARAAGDQEAARYLTDAKSARDLVLQENPNSLTILPSELAPAAPAATTTAPATPAAKPPATPPAAAPADGAAPATPAAPADGAAPATPAAPADGAAPATPAAPADGAAPATPAAPADGTAPATPAAPADGAAPATPAAPAESATPATPAAPATPPL
jgi:predicted metal-dependent phosphoesterase TrpH